MSRIERFPRFIWRLMRFLPPRIAYLLGLGALVGHFILILETTGRRSGLPRQTPLAYDEFDGEIYIGSARGTRADWYKNLACNPIAAVTIGARRFYAHAELITDAHQIARFLELRIKRRPRMLGLIFKLAGLPAAPSPAELEQYAAQRALVVLRPVKDETGRPVHPTPD